MPASTEVVAPLLVRGLDCRHTLPPQDDEPWEEEGCCMEISPLARADIHKRRTLMPGLHACVFN